MTEVTKEQIAALAKLQRLELDITEITMKLSQVNQRFEVLDGKQIDFMHMIEQLESTIKEMNQRYRAYESDAKTNLDRIKKSEAKLSRTNRA